MVESSVRLAGSRGRAEMQEKLVEKLVRKQVQFRQAEQMAQMGHWRLDLATELVHWSDGIFEIHGLPVASTPPLELALSFYTPHSRAQLEGLMARAESAGSGTDGGAGAGEGGGIGAGKGDGLGPGQGGGAGGGVYRPGNGVETPRLLREVTPKYTAEAMRAKVQGIVLVEAVVLPDGSVGDVTIVRSLDRNFGLDDEAINAAKQWRFQPGMRFGEPVAVLVTIELSFTLR